MGGVSALEQALRCLLLITGFSLVILGANVLYS